MNIDDKTILPLPILNDNYIWLIIERSTSKAIAVDPGDAVPLINFIEKNQIHLAAILITHHHHDHCGGLDQLSKQYQVPIYGPQHKNIKGISHPVKNGALIHIESPSLQLNVINIPGHTLEHVAYYAPGFIFCGDTLFSAGCGKIFEGTAEQMYESIQKIASLDDSTDIYCTHEYTFKNLQFAALVEPNNREIQKMIGVVKELRNNNQPTLPTKLNQEKRINPFLRCGTQSVTESVENYAGHKLNTPIEVFTWLRRWKDNF